MLDDGRTYLVASIWNNSFDPDSAVLLKDNIAAGFTEEYQRAFNAGLEAAIKTIAKSKENIFICTQKDLITLYAKAHRWRSPFSTTLSQARHFFEEVYTIKINLPSGGGI